MRRRRNLARRHAVARHRSTATRTASPAGATARRHRPCRSTMAPPVRANRGQRRQVAQPRRRHGHLDRAARRTARIARARSARSDGTPVEVECQDRTTRGRIARDEVGRNGPATRRPRTRRPGRAPVPAWPAAPPPSRRIARPPRPPAGHHHRFLPARQRRGHVEVPHPVEAQLDQIRRLPRRRGRPTRSARVSPVTVSHSRALVIRTNRSQTKNASPTVRLKRRSNLRSAWVWMSSDAGYRPLSDTPIPPPAKRGDERAAEWEAETMAVRKTDRQYRTPRDLSTWARPRSLAVSGVYPYLQP